MIDSVHGAMVGRDGGTWTLRALRLAARLRDDDSLAHGTDIMFAHGTDIMFSIPRIDGYRYSTLFVNLSNPHAKRNKLTRCPPESFRGRVCIE